MTPAALADIHAAAFHGGSHSAATRAWSAAEFADLLADPTMRLHEAADGASGFLLGRVVAGEAELLTLAVRPDARRAGLGTRLLATFLRDAAARGAAAAHLEVAETNAAARALYRRAGFAERERRPGYYRLPGGAGVDAVVLSRVLTA